MSRLDKVQRVAGILFFVLHICVFVFVAVICCLPFKGDRNFYECFAGYFGEWLSAAHPYFLLAILALSCVAAFFAIKRPAFSVAVLTFSLMFFVMAVMPYAIEVMVVGLMQKWVGGEMSEYQSGFKLLGGASYVVYADAAYIIFSFAAAILNEILKGRSDK